MHEFNLIEQYFKWDNAPETVALSVGDDAAILNIPVNQQLVTSVDTLISGVHFPEDTSAHAIGHKALAVNLSDLAAMGAIPKWFTLALTLPEINQSWLEAFSSGLKSIADEHNCFLIGGDTTRGPLSITIQVMGLVESGKALLRGGAKVGDKIYVTGTLGDAAFGLRNKDNDFCKQRLDYPSPRLLESGFIKAFASSCLDISDGLLQDLSHILKASSVGAELDLSLLPLSNELRRINNVEAINYALSGGDDYELLFTIPSDKQALFHQKLSKSGGVYPYIGTITQEKETIMDEKGHKLISKGYNHFYG